MQAPRFMKRRSREVCFRLVRLFKSTSAGDFPIPASGTARNPRTYSIASGLANSDCSFTPTVVASGCQLRGW
jgi:hypothetical protein